MNDIPEVVKTKFLKEIEDYKKAILMASAGAYLHNLGKVSKAFQKEMADGGNVVFSYQHFISLLLDDLNNRGSDDSYRNLTQNGFERRVNRDRQNEPVFNEESQQVLRQKLLPLPKPFDDCEYRIGDFIEYLGLGNRWARLYFRKDANRNEDHCLILNNIKDNSADPADHPYYIELIRGTTSLLTHLMNRCHHGASGGEKDVFYYQEQGKDTKLYIGTPFGFEAENADEKYSRYRELREKAEKAIKEHLSKSGNKAFSLNSFIEDLKPIFQQAMADSRRPFNNISVYDIGHSGMALFKSGIWTLRNKDLKHDCFWTNEGEWLRWRLLRFSLDGIGYLAESISIGDLRVRQEKLNRYFDQVKRLLEEEYPVATEVYRDENGSVFVFPDWRPDSDETKVIKQLIDDKCGIKSGESVISKMYGNEPSMQISVERFMAHPGDAIKTNSLYIGKEMQEIILNPLPANPIPEAFTSGNSEKPNTDICPYCGLRLISKKYESRTICKECMDERRGAAAKWWGGKKENERSRTVWLEEIADDYGRLALIIGRFFPERFIELDYLPVSSEKMKSAEAFARQRRIWETCRQFWVDVNDDIGGLIGYNNQRLGIMVEKSEQKGKDLSDLSAHHTYELIVDGKRLMVMWTGADFITLENLNGFEKRNGLGKTADEYLVAYIDKPATIRIPGGYGSKTAEWGSVIIKDVRVDDTKYISAMPVLAEPRTFMYLVPADKAIEVVERIKSKYEKEMGQVRGRLPLHLGVVYANRYTPFRAILDAGRRMLNQGAVAASAEVVCKVHADNNNKLNLYWQIEDEKATTYWPIALKTGGDSNIEDDWYPYLPVSWEGSSSGGRTLELESPATVYYGNSVKEIKEMIHVKKLAEGDWIILYPSTFDFEYLDSAGIRFEIAYEKRKRKSLDKAQRPYLLEQVDELNKIWEVLKAGALNRNQIYALRDAIASKREEWNQSYSSIDETFKQFCRDMLVTATWSKQPWEKDETNHKKFFDQWADYAVRGWFEDVVQLYLQIMKDKIGKGGSENGKGI